MAESEKLPIRIGDQVRIDCGSIFDGYEGAVVEGPLQNAKFRIEITIFGNKVPLVMDMEQIEKVAKLNDTR